jgi:hypothetical protein
MGEGATGGTEAEMSSTAGRGNAGASATLPDKLLPASLAGESSASGYTTNSSMSLSATPRNKEPLSGSLIRDLLIFDPMVQ